MDLTSSVDSTAQYHVVWPLFFDDDVIGVLDGKYVQGTVARRSVTAFRLERRTSFKHPIIGLLLGLVLVGIPTQALAGDPLGLWWLTLASPMRLAGSFFMVCFGVFLLGSVMRRRDEPWVVFVTSTGEHGFPLRHNLSSEASEALRSICSGPAGATPPPKIAV